MNKNCARLKKELDFKVFFAKSFFKQKAEFILFQAYINLIKLIFLLNRKKRLIIVEKSLTFFSVLMVTDYV